MLKVRKRKFWEKSVYSVLAGALILGQSSGAVLAAEGELATVQQVEQPTEPQPEAAPQTTTEPVTEVPVTDPQPVQPVEPSNSQGPTSTPGPTGPTGPTSSPGPTSPTGKIPNYAFDDSAGRWVPTNTATFSWNPKSGLYESPLYRYDPVVGWYHVIPGAQAQALTLPTSAQGAPVVASSAQINPAAVLASMLGLAGSNSNTGPDSQNSIGVAASTEAMLKNLTNALINNISNTAAISGDATVDGNTNAGDAITGAARVVENLFNLLNAAWSWANGGLSYFAQNLFGDHFGDITIDPQRVEGAGGQLGSYNPNTGASNTNTGPDSQNEVTLDGSSDITVINQPNGAINNNLNLLAQSGNASVTNNTNAGNATSGMSSVEVNILNLINSAINAGDSFFGLLNIFGDFNGDVLFPDGFLNSVVGPQGGSGNLSAANSYTGPNSSNAIQLNGQNNTNIANSPSAYFNNNIESVTQSGNSLVDGNTSAGSSLTGNATTENNSFNIFNTSLAGDNAVLVLVNVMGQWVGHIMNLPSASGSTGALLAGNATSSNSMTGPGSGNTIDGNSNTNLNITDNPVGSISNNINAGAISGNATVSGNTSAGNATSGDASVSTNIANIFGSQFNLNRWFGVLVINVFGNWTGSVADDTSAGESASNLLNSQQQRTATTKETIIQTNSMYDGQRNNSQFISNTGGNSSLQSGSNVESGTTTNLTPNAVFAAATNRSLDTRQVADSAGLLAGLAAAALLMSGAAIQIRRKLMV